MTQPLTARLKTRAWELSVPATRWSTTRAHVCTGAFWAMSLPFVLSGAKIAAAVAAIGAVFGEWAGANDGLGHLMLVDNAQLEVPRMFAAMVWLSAMAIALFGLLSMIERRIAWWGAAEHGPQAEAGGQ